ncbi:MAG: hypothetical protein H6Q68_1608 [Firmicutes bacterium]|nr:hypothetical protein [Bacillota bacterium]
MLKKQQSRFSTRVVFNTHKIIAIYLVLSILWIKFFDHLIPQLPIGIMMINKIFSFKC